MIHRMARRLTITGFALLALLAAATAMTFRGRIVSPTLVDATEPGGVCPLHHLPLVEGKAPIIYGFPPRWTKADTDSYQAMCPKARPFVNGGCVPGMATTARVSYCPECRKAYPAWQDAHPNAR
jgi:hypothetical protein